jgi:outer membrane immunogenic protein
MKKLFLAASLAATATSAIAADLPSRKEPVAAPTPPAIWTGFYAGLNAGGAWASNNNIHIYESPAWINPNTTAAQSVTTAMGAASAGGGGNAIIPSNGAFIGGGQIGYNEQFRNIGVIGIEADIQGVAGGNASTSVYNIFQFSYASQTLGRVNNETVHEFYTASKNLSYLGTVRGRVGILATPSALAYLTGGLAYGGVSINTNGNSQHSNTVTEEIGPGSTSYYGTKLGWTAGGGVEWMFSQNWSLKAEYLYYSLSPVSINMGQGATHVINNGAGLSAGGLLDVYNFTARTNFNGNIVRAGVNYHFNFASAPVVAKF